MTPCRSTVTTIVLIAAGATAVGLPGPSTGGEQAGQQDRKVDFRDVPVAVRHAFGRIAGAAEASAVEQNVQGGVTTYALEYPAAGGSARVKLSEQGDFIASRTPVAADALPEAVRRAIVETYPGATIATAEAVQLSFYELGVQLDGRSREIVVFASGQIGEDEDEEDDEDEEGEGDEEGDDDEEGEEEEDDADEGGKEDDD